MGKFRGIGWILGVTLVTLAGCSGAEVGTTAIEPETGEAAEEVAVSLEVVEENIQVAAEDGGDLRVAYSGKVKNTSDQMVNFDGVELTVEKSDGTILGVEQVLIYAPREVEPGGVSYFGTNFSVENVTSEDELGSITSKLDYEASTRTVVPLEAIGMQLLPSEYFNYAVTGKLKNNTAEPMDNIDVGVAFLGEKGELLSVSTAIVDELQPGEETAVEINPMLSIRDKIEGKVKSFEILAVDMK